MRLRSSRTYALRRLDRAPADGLTVEIGDEPARRVRLGMSAVGLNAESVGTFLDGNRGPFDVANLEPLALASRGFATRAEDGLQVLAGRFVGRDDRDGGSRRGVGRACTKLEGARPSGR